MNISLTLFLALFSPAQLSDKVPATSTKIEDLVKSRSIDKLRAIFLQSPNDEARTEVRTAIMKIVADVLRERSKVHVAETKGPKLLWPGVKHDGFVDLNLAVRKTSHTLYGRHLAPNLLNPSRKNDPSVMTWFQLIVVAGELDSAMDLNECILLCDSVSQSSKLTDTIVIASSDVKINLLHSGMVISNGRVDIWSAPDDPIYTRDEIFLAHEKLSVKDYIHKNNGKANGTYYAEGKTPETGLKFFKLSDLGLVCKLDSDKTIIVESVKIGSPAEIGQLKVGDKLTFINQRKVNTLEKVEELFRYSMMDGPKAKIAVARGLEKLDLEILFP